MSWKIAFRSFCHETAEEPDDIELVPSETALLVIDIQNTYVTYVEPKNGPVKQARWKAFVERMNKVEILNTSALQG